MDKGHTHVCSVNSEWYPLWGVDRRLWPFAREGMEWQPIAYCLSCGEGLSEQKVSVEPEDGHTN